MRKSFTLLRKKDLDRIIQQYKYCVISGGEPLIPANWRDLIMVLQRARANLRSPIVYTNLSTLPSKTMVDMVGGWTCGFHPSQTTAREFAGRVRELLGLDAQSVRVNVEDRHLISLSQYLPNADLRPFTMNDCARDSEDIYILNN
jgi:hypothetical protein